MHQKFYVVKNSRFSNEKFSKKREKLFQFSDLTISIPYRKLELHLYWQSLRNIDDSINFKLTQTSEKQAL